MLVVCLSIVITSNVNKSTKKKSSQQKRKELIREVQNFSEGQKQDKQKEIIRDYNNFKKQSQSNINDLMACPPKVVPSVKLVVVEKERNRVYDT